MILNPQPISIRQKITYGFTALLLLVVTTALLTYGLVLRVERKVYLVEVFDDFFNVSLELRRSEKNYFLYRQEADYQNVLKFLAGLENTLETHETLLKTLLPNVHLAGMDQEMGMYRARMQELHLLVHESKRPDLQPAWKTLSASIRESGQRLTDFAEKTAAAERESIKKLLFTSRTILIASALVLILAALAMAILLVRKILFSLNTLEGYARNVSKGELIDPPAGPVEEEIGSLFAAFARMNNELRLRQRQMVQSEKLASLGTLLAGVAHELNNPLSNISTSAQILEEELEQPDPEFQKTLLGQIQSQTDKARDIVRTLLEFSRTREFRKEELVLNTLLEETLQLLRGDVGPDITIHLDLERQLPVFADKQRLQQVFLNLIKNSIDALEGRGNIWVSAAMTHSQSVMSGIEIFFEDDGPGIDPSLFKKVFDPFYTTKDVGKGSGLGLFIVHDIIETHGGTVSMDSHPGEGTTFVLWLPGRGEGE